MVYFSVKNRFACRVESCLWSRFLLGMIAECKKLGGRKQGIQICHSGSICQWLRSLG